MTKKAGKADEVESSYDNVAFSIDNTIDQVQRATNVVLFVGIHDPGKPLVGHSLKEKKGTKEKHLNCFYLRLDSS